MKEEKENKKMKKEFPKGFFSIPRPTISIEKALEDITPIEWKKNGKEILVHSAKEKKTL